MHLKSKPSCTGVARKLRLREYPCPSPQTIYRDLVETCGVWGEVPAADDFGAFFCIEESLWCN